MGFPGGARGKEPACQCRRHKKCSLNPWIGKIPESERSPDREDPLEEGMATHSSIFIWRIPWTEEPGELQSIGLQRVGHN